MANIVFDGVEKSFSQGGKEFLAVGETNFTVADKEFVAIVGPSGCGKTTCSSFASVVALSQPQALIEPSFFSNSPYFPGKQCSIT